MTLSKKKTRNQIKSEALAARLKMHREMHSKTMSKLSSSKADKKKAAVYKKDHDLRMDLYKAQYEIDKAQHKLKTHRAKQNK